MTLPKLAPLALVLVACCALAAAPERRVVKPAPADPHRLTGILHSVDHRSGTFTLRDVGIDVDDALLRKLKEPGRAGAGKNAGADRRADDAGPEKLTVVRLGAKAKVFIKFRSSPSVANNVEVTLADLERMTGWPLSAVVNDKADPKIATEVVAWRGTPMRVR